MKRIMFLMLFAVLLAMPMVSEAFSCGGGTCKSDESCCDDSVCCPSGKNLYCSGSNKCYSSISDAKADCGDSYTVCASPAEGKMQEFIIEPSGMRPKEEMTKNVEVTVKSKEYNCLCTKCNYNWVSTDKPTKCPDCGSKQIIYTESTSENTVNKEELVAGDNNIVLAASCIE